MGPPRRLLLLLLLSISALLLLYLGSGASPSVTLTSSPPPHLIIIAILRFVSIPLHLKRQHDLPAEVGPTTYEKKSGGNLHYHDTLLPENQQQQPAIIAVIICKQSGLQAGPAATSPPAPQPLVSKKKQKLPALAEEEVVDTEINKEILRAAAKRPQSYKSAQPSGNSLRKRPNNQVY